MSKRVLKLQPGKHSKSELKWFRARSVFCGLQHFFAKKLLQNLLQHSNLWKSIANNETVYNYSEKATSENHSKTNKTNQVTKYKLFIKSSKIVPKRSLLIIFEKLFYKFELNWNKLQQMLVEKGWAKLFKSASYFNKLTTISYEF